MMTDGSDASYGKTLSDVEAAFDRKMRDHEEREMVGFKEVVDALEKDARKSIPII